MSYYLCLYDLEGKLITSRKFGCGGCAKKKIPKLSPACLREGSVTGKVIKSNDMFKSLGIQ